jgi:hypothetical protein
MRSALRIHSHVPPALTFTNKLRGSVLRGSGWSVPCVSIQLTLSQQIVLQFFALNGMNNNLSEAIKIHPLNIFIYLAARLAAACHAARRAAACV